MYLHDRFFCDTYLDWDIHTEYLIEISQFSIKNIALFTHMNDIKYSIDNRNILFFHSTSAEHIVY